MGLASNVFQCSAVKYLKLSSFMMLTKEVRSPMWIFEKMLPGELCDLLVQLDGRPILASDPPGHASLR